MELKLTVEEKITKARIQLQTSHPFWARLILSLDIKKGELPSGAFAAVDPNGKMYYNEEVFKKLSLQDIKYIMAHEVSHIALGHLIRLGTRDLTKWNIANDLIINNMLNNDGFISPKEGLIPNNNTFKFENTGQIIRELNNKSSEEVYDEIKDESSNGLGEDGRFDEHQYKEMSEKEREEVMRKWKNNLLDAANYSKIKGQNVGSFQRMIDEIVEPKVNWKHILNRYIVNSLPNDYTYMKRSKKSLATGIYMPSIKKENVDVVVHIDTSGSIDQNILTDFVSEIVGIARSFNNLTMTLIECDCEINQVMEIKNGNIDKIMKMEMKGGGGTSHKPLWNYVKEEIMDCKLLISLTDGYSDIEIDDRPDYDVVFVLPKFNHNEPCFGEKIEL